MMIVFSEKRLAKPGRRRRRGRTMDPYSKRKSHENFSDRLFSILPIFFEIRRGAATPESTFACSIRKPSLRSLPQKRESRTIVALLERIGKGDSGGFFQKRKVRKLIARQESSFTPRRRSWIPAENMPE